MRAFLIALGLFAGMEAFAGYINFMEGEIIVGSPKEITDTQVVAKANGYVALIAGKDVCRIEAEQLKELNIDPVSLSVQAIEKSFEIDCVQSKGKTVELHFNLSKFGAQPGR